MNPGQADRWSNINGNARQADLLDVTFARRRLDATLSKRTPVDPRSPMSKGSNPPRHPPTTDPYSTQAGRARGEPATFSSSSSSFSPRLPPLEKLLGLPSSTTFVTATHDMGLSANAAEPPQWAQEMPLAPPMFSKNKPSCRMDAVILNKWISSVLDRYAEKMAAGKELKQQSLPQVVDELVPMLALGLHELSRQVKQSCNERGVVLEKIWRSYVELFDRALEETRGLLRLHQERTNRVKDKLHTTNAELEDLKKRQPQQSHKLSATLNNKFIQRQEELNNLLKKVRHENANLVEVKEDRVRNVETWFPRFDAYKDTYLRALLKNVKAELPSHTTPESRIAADFKRILSVMPMEARRRVGFFVSSLLGLRGTELVDNPETVDSLLERKEHNDWTINLLGEKLKVLQKRKADQQQNEELLDSFDKDPKDTKVGKEALPSLAKVVQEQLPRLPPPDEDLKRQISEASSLPSGGDLTRQTSGESTLFSGDATPERQETNIF